MTKTQRNIYIDGCIAQRKDMAKRSNETYVETTSALALKLRALNQRNAIEKAARRAAAN